MTCVHTNLSVSGFRRPRLGGCSLTGNMSNLSPHGQWAKMATDDDDDDDEHDDADDDGGGGNGDGDGDDDNDDEHDDDADDDGGGDDGDGDGDQKLRGCSPIPSHG